MRSRSPHSSSFRFRLGLSSALAVGLMLAACSSEEPSVPLSPEAQEQRELGALADSLRLTIDEYPAKCKELGKALAAWHTEHAERFATLRKKHPKLPGDEWARWNQMDLAINRAWACVGTPMIGMDDPEVKRVLTALAL